MTGKDIDDELAYGDYNQGKSSSGGKSFVGSLYRSFTGKDENKKPAEEQEVGTSLQFVLPESIAYFLAIIAQ